MNKKTKKNPFQIFNKEISEKDAKEAGNADLLAIILAFVVLIGRITYINVFKGGKYTRIVLNQQQYGSRTFRINEEIS